MDWTTVKRHQFVPTDLLLFSGCGVSFQALDVAGRRWSE